jgi:hypothetical protein
MKKLQEVITYPSAFNCTLISENQGLEKSRSISNPRKISVSANLDFFIQVSTLKKSLVDTYYRHRA